MNISHGCITRKLAELAFISISLFQLISIAGNPRSFETIFQRVGLHVSRDNAASWVDTAQIMSRKRQLSFVTGWDYHWFLSRCLNLGTNNNSKVDSRA